ncbi:MAG: chorismate synthase [Alistipes sp.]|nr:chorismate synthase [Alistipes sp.]
MNQFGHHFRLSIWGESHGYGVGVVLDGVPAGIPLSAEDFEADMARRRGGAPGTTPRSEADVPALRSGIYEGRTTGAPIAIEFVNANVRSQDYAGLRDHCRPSHADLTARQRFDGCNDPRGGGHFSARLTAALTAAGVVAKKMLPKEVTFSTRLVEIGGCDSPERFDAILREAAAARDSVGGVVECRVQGIPAGWGEPFFDSAESLVAHLLFAVPAVKGVEFGSGFAAARMRGSEHNDPILDAEGRTATNHAGGIVGGLTNGNELVVRAAVKPTPSIAREQHTYNFATGRVEPLVIRGRHDVCVALRGAVVVEAAVAIALADLIRR